MKKVIYLSAIAIALLACTDATAGKQAAVKSALTDTIPANYKRPTEPMTDVQVTAILNKMRQKRNDAEKVQVIKTELVNNGIKTEQLMTLLNQFLTDDSKITSAQFAFPYLTNPKAFLKIMDLFAEERFKGRLEEFYDKNKKLYK